MAPLGTGGSDDLLEREAELATFDAALEAARRGAGSLLALEGPAGIGKTRLLAAAAERASELGVEVLRARGSELERSSSFGLARQLFEPHLRGATAEEREALLDGAAALAAPALGVAPLPSETAPTSVALDPMFATLHGLYWLAANLAERAPVLLALDDLHWADAGSLRFLAFLFPRLPELPVLSAIAYRRGEPGVDSEPLDELAASPGARLLRPRPLSGSATRELVRARLSPEADDAFCSACLEVTGGNPFLLGELLAELAAEGMRPTATAAKQVRDFAPPTVARSVLVRLARLGEPAAALARSVAVLGDGAPLARAAELSELEPAAARRGADALARAGILASGSVLSFAHPLLRSAVYSELSPGARAEAHERAARLLAEAGAPADSIAVHLVATDPAAKPFVVATLRAAAAEAMERGDSKAEVAYLSRALAEPPPAGERAAVLRELGLAEVRAGELSGPDHLREGLAQTDDLETLAALGPTLAIALVFMGRAEEAVEMLDRALSVPSGAAREIQLAIDAQLIGIAQHASATAPLARERLRRIPPGLRGDTPAERLALAALARERAKLGRDAAGAADLAVRALGGDRLLSEQGVESNLYFGAIWTLVAAERVDLAAECLEEALSESRRRGSLGPFMVACQMRSFLAYLRGAIAEAEADARLAIDAARLHGAIFAMPHALASLNDALLERGETDAAAAALAEGGFGEEVPDTMLISLLLFSRGALRLAAGELRAGLGDLLEFGRRKGEWGMTTPCRWAPLAVDALVRSGGHEEARRVAAASLAEAESWGTPIARGVALRACGLGEQGERSLELLRESASLLESTPARLEHARALTDLGAALRRSNRRSEARETLRTALDLADRCGAAASASRARQELIAAGGKPRRAALSGPEALTPSEERIARMAAEGLSNREIAQALFVTKKTVEMHLGNAYRKLDIRSRKELTQALESERSGTLR